MAPLCSMSQDFFKVKVKTSTKNVKSNFENGKVAWQGQAGCSPSARPLLRSIKSDKMTFIALLYSPISALHFAFSFYFFVIFFLPKQLFLVYCPVIAKQHIFAMSKGGAVGIFCRVGCCWILSGHRLIRTTLYILSLSRPHFLKQASMRTLFSVCVDMIRWYWNLFAFLQAMDWLWMSTYLDRVRHQVLLPGTDQYLTLSLTEKISPQFYIFTNIPSCLYADVFTVKSHQIRLFVNILRQCLSRRGTFGKSLL